MPDVHNKITRSYNMSRVRSKNTKPEMLVRSFLHGKGFRYKLHVNNLPGKPDLVLPKYHTIIFVHGCFWHGHEGCKYFTVPQTRKEWWLNKIDTNIRNDEKSINALKEAGWRIVTIWGCELKPDKIEKTFRRLIRVFT